MLFRFVNVILFSGLICQGTSAGGFVCSDNSGLSVTVENQSSEGGLPGSVRLDFKNKAITEFRVSEDPNRAEDVRFLGFWDDFEDMILINVVNQSGNYLKVKVRGLKLDPKREQTSTGKMTLNGKIGSRKVTRKEVPVDCVYDI